MKINIRGKFISFDTSKTPNFDKSRFLDIADIALGLKIPIEAYSRYEIKTKEDIKEVRKIERKSILDYLKNGELPFQRCLECKKIKSKEKFINPRTKKKTSNNKCIDCNTFIHTKAHYNLDKRAYEKILEYQNNCCGICKTHINKTVLNVDHDHKTGKVRGLLCHGCNTGIGGLKDNKQFLINAINYLEKGEI